MALKTLFIFMCLDGASIKFRPPSSTVQYVFDDGQISDVRMTWHYEVSFCI